MSIKSQLKGLDKAVQTGVTRALNKSLATGRTQLVRSLRESTGLKTEDINKRILSKQAKADKFKVSLYIAIKRGIPLRKFSPIIKAIRVGSKKFYGITAKIGRAGRALIEGAFALDNSYGIVVVGRKKAFTNGVYSRGSTARKPLFELKSNIFIEEAKHATPDAQKKIEDNFDKIVSSEIEYAVQSKFNSNK